MTFPIIEKSSFGFVECYKQALMSKDSYKQCSGYLNHT